jgi:hypothetical protein
MKSVSTLLCNCVSTCELLVVVSTFLYTVVDRANQFENIAENNIDVDIKIINCLFITLKVISK